MTCSSIYSYIIASVLYPQDYFLPQDSRSVVSTMKRLQWAFERPNHSKRNESQPVVERRRSISSGVSTDCASDGFDCFKGLRTNRRRASIGGASPEFLDKMVRCHQYMDRNGSQSSSELVFSPSSAKTNGTKETLETFSSNSTCSKTRVGKIPSISPDYNRHRQRPNVSGAENETTTTTTISPAVIATQESTSNTESQAAAPVSVSSCTRTAAPILASPLPSNLKVLIVESDAVMRKIIRKLLKGIEPSWKIKEAPDGEIAVAMVAEALLFEKELDNQSQQARRKPFDLIFIDQYLTSSVDRGMLGTDTVPKLRDLGAKCCICGLSSNWLKDEFQMVGANSFLLKPFPTNQYILIDTLAGIIKKRRRRASA